jgi:hypothetical protein
LDVLLVLHYVLVRFQEQLDHIFWGLNLAEFAATRTLVVHEYGRVFVVLNGLLDQGLVHVIDAHVLLLIPLDQEATNFLEQLVNKVNLGRILEGSK